MQSSNLDNTLRIMLDPRGSDSKEEIEKGARYSKNLFYSGLALLAIELAGLAFASIKFDQEDVPGFDPKRLMVGGAFMISHFFAASFYGIGLMGMKTHAAFEKPAPAGADMDY